ncbi:MAG: Holliday junction resolvase RuvX, partial [Candidatus Magasanikbacteria bacterium]|nr:Holliday junction resolvase RuvX [Candidatus Magasanikbacteria bacterium]
MNVLGVDYGTKRIGLAWADDAMGFVLPYGVLVDSHTTKEEQLRALIKEERINKVVVGLPIGLDGEDKV